MFPHFDQRGARRGVTLLELITVILVIVILVVMLLPVYAQIKSRSQKVVCISNLRSLHTAANLYIQEHHFWPQIKTDGIAPNDVATHWINALQPYGLTQSNWLCPTIQEQLGNPDMTDHDNARIDYIANPFDAYPLTPYRWATQPWFVESVSAHGNGQLILFPDGHIQEAGDFRSKFKKPGSTP